MTKNGKGRRKTGISWPHPSMIQLGKRAPKAERMAFICASIAHGGERQLITKQVMELTQISRRSAQLDYQYALKMLQRDYSDTTDVMRSQSAAFYQTIAANPLFKPSDRLMARRYLAHIAHQPSADARRLVLVGGVGG